MRDVAKEHLIEFRKRFPKDANGALALAYLGRIAIDERQPAAVDRWSLCLPGELPAAGHDLLPERAARVRSGVRAQRAQKGK